MVRSKTERTWPYFDAQSPHFVKEGFHDVFFSENCWYNAVDFQLLTHSSGVIQTKGNEKMPAIQ